MTVMFPRPSMFNLARRFIRNRRGSSAVEFAIVAMPFFMVLMGIVQVGIFYMAQSALDAGVIRTAEDLNEKFIVKPAAVLLDAATLKSNVASKGGGMIQAASLKVELQQLSTLAATPTAINGNIADYGGTTSVLVLRAEATVPTLAPGLSALTTIRSSAMVRRQGT